MPVIIVTGWYLDIGHEEASRALDATAFLRKPLEWSEIAAAVREAIASYVARSAGLPACPSGPVGRTVPRISGGGHARRFPHPEMPGLHERAVQGDGTAVNEIISSLLPELRRRLSTIFPYALDDWIENSIEDALLEYKERPNRYDPSRRVPLDKFLLGASRRNALNYIDSNRRRARHETSGMESRFWDALASATDGAHGAGHGHASELDARLSTMTADFTPEERRVLDLRLKGERRTSVYARALNLTHLAFPEQRAKILTIKNRVFQRLRRRFARSGQSHWAKSCG